MSKQGHEAGKAAPGGTRWRRVGGFSVVMSWQQTGFSSGPPRAPGPPSFRARIAGILGTVLVLGGLSAVGFALASQVRAPQPAAAAAGTTGSRGQGQSLPRSVPVALAVPAIGVRSPLLQLGLNPDGTMQVPSLATEANEAAWYKYSQTPGQIGSSVIEGHVDSLHGPAVFFQLGALRPGDAIDVTLADHATAIFQVTGVREYSKDHFPDSFIYGPEQYAALRLITCGGTFDHATGHYLSTIVVFAKLISARPG